VDVAELGDEELAHIHISGFVFQQFHLLPQLSALENVAPMVYAGVNTDVRRDRAMAALKRE